LLFRGRHVGPFLGYAPTGAEVSWTGAALFRVRHGRIADIWVLGDLNGLLAQLEAQRDHSAPGRRTET